jgi:hypothetical protein
MFQKIQISVTAVLGTLNSTYCYVGYCAQRLVCLKYRFRMLDSLPSSGVILQMDNTASGHLQEASVYP